MTGRRARRALDRILAANSLDEVLACPPNVRGDVYEALLELQEPSPWWQHAAATVARRRSVTAAYVVDRAMAWLATLAELRRHDLYAFFGVEPGATADDIRNRWRVLAKRYHPDNGGTDPVLFRRFQEAYAILSDPVQRMRYEDGWRRRNGPVVALITQATRPARSRRRGTPRRRRAKSGLQRVRAWAGRMRANAGPALRTVGLAAAVVLAVRFGRLPELSSPTTAEAPPVVVAEAPKAAVTVPMPPARPTPPPPKVIPAPVVAVVPTAPPPVVAPVPFGETVADAEMLAQAEPVVVDEMTLVPEPVAVADSGLMAPIVSVAEGPRTTTPASVRRAAPPTPSTTRSARAAAEADTATPAGRRSAVVTAEVVPTTPAPPVMRLAAAATAPPVANPAAQDRRPAASATTLPPVTTHPMPAPPAARTAKAPPPAKPAKVVDKRAKASKPDKTAKVAAAKRPAPRVVAKPVASARPVVMVAAPTGMMMSLTSPEPLDLRSAQGFVREFARRYSAHESMGLLEMFAAGGSADGRHGVAIAEGFGATFRRLGDVKLEPAHVELQPMASGAVVRADYTLLVPGRDPVRGRAQWTLVREGGNVRAAQMLSSTVK